MSYGNRALAAIVVVMCVACARTAVGQQETIIHSFATGDGTVPFTGLVRNSSGSFFGTTTGGGSSNDGTVFELTKDGSGNWDEKLLYSFTGSHGDGSGPQDGLTLDAKGDVFGVTTGGGSNQSGTVFELTQGTNGFWTEKVLHEFGSSATDGTYPRGALIFDAQGDLYGTTENSGKNGVGTAYELTPSGSGSWTEKILYHFGANSTDAASPMAGLTIDSAGNLYGTTTAGGPSYDQSFYGPITGGTVFELTPSGGGSWTEKILHDFVPGTINEFGYLEPSGDGWTPTTAVLLDNKGNLYGTTENGTASDGYSPSSVYPVGATFELKPAAGGSWTETVSFSSCENGTTCFPSGDLTMDPAGNLYDTTTSGGSYLGMANGTGSTVYENGTVLHNFPTTAMDGYGATGQVIFDSSGNLYGTTEVGGANNLGTVYEIEGAASAAQIGTTASMTVNPSGNLVAGEPITLTATLSPVSGSAMPSGTVTFIDPAGGSVTELLIAGKAMYSGTVPPVGQYSVYAQYNGAPGFAATKSATVTRMVTSH